LKIVRKKEKKAEYMYKGGDINVCTTNMV
jgi:hypothetical protein